MENAKVSFGVVQKSPYQLKQEEDLKKVAEIEAELKRVQVDKDRWTASLREDALDKARAEKEKEKDKEKSSVSASSSSATATASKNEKTKRPRPLKSPPKKTKNVNKLAENDIDPSTNMIDCPNCCGKLIRVQDLAKHERTCSNRLITCPEPGCDDKILYCDIKRHRETRCKVALRREKLLHQKHVREKSQVEAAVITETVAVTKTAAQIQEDAVNAKRVEKSKVRKAMLEELSRMHREDHRMMKREKEALLFDVFDIDPDLEARAERARLRQQEVSCPNCGEPVVAMWLKKHLDTTCLNRKVSLHYIFR